MKTIKNILVSALVLLFAVACKNEATPELKSIDIETTAAVSKTLDANAAYAKAEFGIEGMTCAIGCAKTIEKKLAKMEGVKSATVDFDKRLAMVEYDEAKVTPTSLEEAVAKAGDTYKVNNMKTVDAFSTEHTCKADCKMACCADKTTEAKKACKEDCKMACCTEKEKS